MHPWIFILFSGLLQSKPLLYLVAQFVPVLATGSVLRLPPMLSQRPSPCYFSLCLKYFLNSGTTKCSCSLCAFFAPVLEASVSPGGCSSVLCFIGKRYLWCKSPVWWADFVGCHASRHSCWQSHWCTGSSRCVSHVSQKHTVSGL